MSQPPRHPSEPIIDRVRWRRIIFYSFVLAAATIGAVFVSQYFVHPGEVWEAQRNNNILFFTLISCQLMHVFNMGSIDLPFWRTEVFLNRYVWFSIAACILIIFGLFQIETVRRVLFIAPMSILDWAVCVGMSFLAMIVVRVGKQLAFFQK